MKTLKKQIQQTIFLLFLLFIAINVIAQSRNSGGLAYKHPVSLPQKDKEPVPPDKLDRIINEIKIYPESLLKKNIGGTVICQFTITVDGETENIRLLKKAHPLLNKEAICIISSLPRFRPAIKDGKLTPYKYQLSINFSPDAYREYHKKRKKDMIEYEELRKRIIGGEKYLYMPEFPGGQGELLKYIKENVRYPESLKGNGIRRRLLCSCDINIFGKPDNIEIVRGGNEYPEMDQEAIRLISEMPAWSTGKYQTKEITNWKLEDVPEGYNRRQYAEYQTVRYTIPVTFTEL